MKIPNVFLNPERQNLQVAKNVVEFFFHPKKNITSCRGFVEGTSRYPVYCLTPNSGGDIAASKTQKKTIFFLEILSPLGRCTLRTIIRLYRVTRTVVQMGDTLVLGFTFLN